MKPLVELLYDLDCPNVAQAREVLLHAFAQSDLPPSWVEIERKAATSPAYARMYGSPTILVNGKDVAGTVGEGADCCRLYPQEGGYRGVPEVVQVAQALSRAVTGEFSPGFRWREFFVTIPGMVVAVLPALHCPACWPAYAGLLSAIGLGFLIDAQYLLPIAAAVLGLTLVALGYNAQSRHGYRPLMLGLIAMGAIILGKVVLLFDAIVWGGLVLLMVASVWNAWPRKEVHYAKD